MNEDIQLERAIDIAEDWFGILSAKYSPEIAKKVFYRLAREQSTKETLLAKKKDLEQKLETIKAQI